jgi:hypothetical protein
MVDLGNINKRELDRAKFNRKVMQYLMLSTQKVTLK